METDTVHTDEERLTPEKADALNAFVEKALKVNALNSLVEEAFSNSCAHGWYEKPRSFGDMLCLIHSELSEALEEFRNGHAPQESYYSVPEGWKEGDPRKPEGVPAELADVLIRIFDMCGFYGIDLGKIVIEKMNYNKTRPYRHGNKRL